MKTSSGPTQLSLFKSLSGGGPQYISVSRRTDIPRFYHQAFLAAWQQGRITYRDGYGRDHTVSLLNRDVLGYIFWSKDYGPLLADHRFKRLLSENNALFHFTINNCPELEPGLIELPERLDTLRRLVDLVGPETIVWRFDPICRYQTKGPIRDNSAPFHSLLPIIAALGIKRCYFSFMTHYPKLQKRRSILFHSFQPEEKIALSSEMLNNAETFGMSIHACCDPQLVASVPNLRDGSCVDNELLARTDRFQRHLSLPRKATRKGCTCHATRDIGDYRQKCGHGCLYCYANPL